MKIFSVGGSQKGVGKTTLACFLLKNFPRFGALKVTVCSGGVCPRPDPCGVCARLDEPFAIIDDDATINAPHTDTARLKVAGAAKVVWLQATEAGLRDGIQEALSRFPGFEGVVAEGNHFISAYPTPGISMMALSVGFNDFKPSARVISDKVDLLVFNRRGGESHSDFLAMLKDLPERLADKQVFLVEPEKAESIDNELFLSRLAGL